MIPAMLLSDADFRNFSDSTWFALVLIAGMLVYIIILLWDIKERIGK